MGYYRILSIAIILRFSVKHSQVTVNQTEQHSFSKTSNLCTYITLTKTT